MPTPFQSFFRHHTLTLVGLLCIIAAAIVVSLITQIPEVSERVESLDLPQKQLTESLPFTSDHPATIPGLRQTSLDKTVLSIERTYETTTAYTSYRASYTSDGNTVYGLLTVPNEEKPAEGFPAIVFLHGYVPPDQYVTTERYVEYVDALAESGFIVFKIDYRGHGESEGETNGAYFSADYVRDVLYALKALRAYEPANPDALGLWGHSMSGNVALRALVADQNIQAAVIWAGAVFSYEDQQKYGIDDNSFVRTRPSEQEILSHSRSLREEYGEFSPDSEFWQKMSPISYLDDIETPIQLHHAENDSVVNIGYSRDLAAELEERELEHEAHFYSTGGHDIEGISFTTAIDRTIEFYRQHLTTE